MPIIIDASVALSWLFADEFSPASEDLLERSANMGVVVPAHWPLELANGALMGERRKRVKPAETARWMLQIGALEAQLDPDTGRNALGQLLPVARAHGLTLYDAAYLELGVRCGSPLATFDKRLAKAARNLDLVVLGE